MNRRHFLKTALLAPAAVQAMPVGLRDVAFLGHRGFTPKRIANLSLWLDPTQLAGIADGTGIATWVDLSGNARNAAQASGPNQPIKQTASNGGVSFPVARFDGTTDMSLVTTSFLGAGWNTAFTMVVAAAQNNNGAALLVMASNAGLALYAGRSTLAPWNTSGLSDTQITTTLHPTYNDWFIHGFRYNGSTKVVHVNGYQRNSESATGNLGLSGGLTVGKLSSGGFLFKGDISHVLIFQRALSDLELLYVQDWVSEQIGMSNKRNLVCEGDSLTQGLAVVYPDDYPTVCQSLLGITLWDKWNDGATGDTLQAMIAPDVNNIDGRLNGFAAKNICVIWGGTNDIYLNAKTGLQTEAYLNTFCTARRAAGWKVIALTMISRGQFDATMEGYRQDFNTAVRANWTTYADALCDVDSDTPVGGVGTYNNGTYYNADKVHLTVLGYATIAAAVKNKVVTL